jgi:hypothetical protein
MDQGRGLVMLGEYVEAEGLLVEALAIFAKSTARMPHFPAWAECWYGASLAGQRRYAEAASHLLAAERVLREARTLPRRQYRQCVEQIVKLYESWGNPGVAARWRTALTALGDSQVPSESKGANTGGAGR